MIYLSYNLFWIDRNILFLILLNSNIIGLDGLR